MPNALFVPTLRQPSGLAAAATCGKHAGLRLRRTDAPAASFTRTFALCVKVLRGLYAALPRLGPRVPRPPLAAAG
jgi:hypothetical protein